MVRDFGSKDTDARGFTCTLGCSNSCKWSPSNGKVEGESHGDWLVKVVVKEKSSLTEVPDAQTAIFDV